MTVSYKAFIIEKDETVSTNLYYIRKANGETLYTENGINHTIDCMEAENIEEVFEYIESLYNDDVTEEIDKTFSAKDLLTYLQSQMDDFKESEKEFGFDRVTRDKMHAMIACKEMVEALIQYPVNLRKDGKVTLGF